LTLLLAYYTAGINEIGSFTLFSNLVITGAGVFFLARHRWAAVSWVALFGTYLSFAWWRGAHVGQAAELPDSPEHGAILTVAFLTGYWLLFTAGAFFASEDALPSRRRAAFISLNNSAFFFFAADAVV